jgi:hypothetical protein
MLLLYLVINTSPENLSTVYGQIFSMDTKLHKTHLVLKKNAVLLQTLFDLNISLKNDSYKVLQGLLKVF